MLTVDLVVHGDASVRIRRRAWFKNRRIIAKLCEDLSRERQALLEGLGADTVYEMRKHVPLMHGELTAYRSSMHGIASTLTVISGQATAIHSVSLGIDQRLQTLEQAFSQGQLLCIANSTMPLALESLEGRSNARSSTTSFTRPPIGKAQSRLCTSASDDVQSASVSETTICPMSSVARHAAPASLRELSLSFLPAAYTNCDPTPNLVSFCDIRINRTQRARVIDLGMFYHQASQLGHTHRQWTSITLRVKVTKDSKYWNMRKVRNCGLDPVTSYSLPTSLLKMLEEALVSQKNIGAGSCLSVNLDSESDLPRHSLVLARYLEPSSQVRRCLLQITSWTRHMKCPWYDEQDLVHQPLNKGRPTNWFIAFLDSRWVMETRFGSDLRQIHADLYVLQVMHCLRAVPGIASFKGVVLDERGIVSAFLSDLPSKGKLCRNWTYDIDGRRLDSWKRREKWCKQVVQAVAQIHEATFVVGNMCKTPDLGIAIDANDDAVLYGAFARDFVYDELHVGSLPPEYWHSVSHGCRVEACPQSDIYQLGLALWALASSRSSISASRSWFCKSAGCTAAVSATCTEPHADPVQLQFPSEDTPQYMRHIISACRAENPEERPAAWQLLEMFPTEAGQSVSGVAAVDAEQHLTRPEACFEKFGQFFSVCDICNVSTGPRKYYCEVCSMGNYDVCQGCLDSGKHCQDTHHLLAEHFYGT